MSSSPALCEVGTLVPMAAIGLFLVEHASVDRSGPGVPEVSKDWHIPRESASPPGGLAAPDAPDFPESCGPRGAGGRGQIGKPHMVACRSPKLLLGQIRCVGGLSLSALIGNIIGLVAFIHTMILFTHWLDLVKKKSDIG